MSNLVITIPDIPDDIATISGKVIGTGIALLFTYTVTLFLILRSISYFRDWLPGRVKKDNKENMHWRNCSKHRRYSIGTVLQVIWLSIIVMFSVFPPFYYGTFSTVMAFVTLVVVVIMHILAMANDIRPKGRSLWSIFYFIYH